MIALQFGWSQDFLYCIEIEQKYYKQKAEEVINLTIKYPNVVSDLEYVLYYTQGFVFGYCLGDGKVLSYGELKNVADTLFNARLKILLECRKQGQ